MAKIQREHDTREAELRKAVEHYEQVKKTAGPSAECALLSVQCTPYFMFLQVCDTVHCVLAVISSFLSLTALLSGRVLLQK